MKFYAHFKMRLPGSENLSALSLLTQSVRFAKRRVANEGRCVKSIVELHLGKQLLDGAAVELGSGVRFPDGGFCFKINGIAVLCDCSLAKDEMVVVCS